MFIGVKPNDVTSHRLSEWMQQHRHIPGIRWIRPQNLHLSALFLGNVPLEQLENLKELFGYGLRDVQSISLQFDAIVAAPLGQRPRMLWARYRKSDEFRLLVQKLQFFYEQIQPRQQNRLSPIPHITLARFNAPDSIADISLPQSLSLPTFTLFDLVLWSSDLQPDGPVYTEIQTFSLSPS